MNGGGDDAWSVANHALIANAVSGDQPANPKNIYGLAAAAAQYAALQVLSATTGAPTDGGLGPHNQPRYNFGDGPTSAVPPLLGAGPRTPMPQFRGPQPNVPRGNAPARGKVPSLFDQEPNNVSCPPGPGNLRGQPPANFGRPPHPGPQSSNRHPGSNRFDRPPGPNNFGRPPAPMNFDGPPGPFDGPPGPNNFNGPPGRFEGIPGPFNGPPGPGHFDGPPDSFDGPPGPFDGPPCPFDGPPGPFDGPPGPHFSTRQGQNNIRGPFNSNNANRPPGPHSFVPRGLDDPNNAFRPEGAPPLMGIRPPNEIMRPRGSIPNMSGPRFGQKQKLNTQKGTKAGVTKGKQAKRTATTPNQSIAVNKKPRVDKPLVKEPAIAIRHVAEDMKVTISGAAPSGESASTLHFYCTACQVFIPAATNFQQHLRGKKHRERVDQAEKDPKAPVAANGQTVPKGLYLTEKDVKWDPAATLISAADAQKSKFSCSTCRMTLVSDENMKYHMARAGHLSRSEVIDSLEKNKSDSEDVCIPCKVLVKTDNKEEHLTDKVHLNNLHWYLAPCELCDTRFNNVEGLYKHFNSEKHRASKVSVKSTNLDHAALVNYFESLGKVAEEKKRSACELCTLFFVTDENKQLHDLYGETKHARRRQMAEVATPGQFYCHACDLALPDSYRASHVKTNEHNMKKTAKQSWNCEDCLEKFNNENGLIIHMATKKHETVVNKRKKLMNLAVNQAQLKWRNDLLDAGGCISGHVRGLIDGGKLPLGDTGGVIQVTGMYCSTCNEFFMASSPPKDLCSHVLLYQHPESISVELDASDSANESTAVDECTTITHHSAVESTTVEYTSAKPVADNSTADNSTADNSTADNSTAHNSTADNSTADNSTADNPTADNPTTGHSAADDFVDLENAAEDQVTENTVAEDPVAEDLVTKDPVTENPVSKDPAADNPASHDSPVDGFFDVESAVIDSTASTQSAPAEESEETEAA